MISFFKNLKANKLLAKSYQLNRGMTYVEIIVVLAIFGIMSSIVMYNYTEFQAKVDIKNLASDIALKIVEAQKSAMNGVLPLGVDESWKPSYGVYFDTTDATTQKQFIYFADINNPSNGYNSTIDRTLDTISIQKGNYIEKIENCAGSPPNCTTIANPLLFSITFTRPSSSAIFTGVSVSGSEYLQITVKSPRSTLTAKIKIYPSGRVQVN